MSTFMGICGGIGGQQYDFYFSEGDIIIIRYGSWIDAIEHQHNGTVDRYGGDGGTNQIAVAIEPGIEITGISGMYGNYIDQLWVDINQGQTGYFAGGEGGVVDFNLQVFPNTNTHIVGFTVRVHTYVDAIGILIE